MSNYAVISACDSVCNSVFVSAVNEYQGQTGIKKSQIIKGKVHPRTGHEGPQGGV
jgi:hypothetical protein